MQGEEVSVAFLDGEAAKGEAKGYVIEGMGFGGGGLRSGGDAEFERGGAHAGGYSVKWFE